MLTAAATLPSDPSPSARRTTAFPLSTVRARRKLAPMRSIFWRIFLWFWLAAVLLAGAVAATVYFTDPDQFFPRSQFVPLQMIDHLAGESVAVFERSGPEGLHEFLTGLPHGAESNGLPSRAHFDHAYLFAEGSDRELAGQTPQIDHRELIARAASSADLQLERRIGRMYMAHAVGDGATPPRKYIFLLSMPRSSLLLPTTQKV